MGWGGGVGYDIFAYCRQFTFNCTALCMIPSSSQQLKRFYLFKS
jgi:hypothetical protein